MSENSVYLVLRYSATSIEVFLSRPIPYLKSLLYGCAGTRLSHSRLYTAPKYIRPYRGDV